VLNQIEYMTLLIARKAYDVVDKNHYLKVYYLLFYNQKLELISTFADEAECDAKTLAKEREWKKSLFESLFQLFKIDFYSDKYISIFEETFDIDVREHTMYL